MNAPRRPQQMIRSVRSVLAWPVETQLGSRRNALVASTALTDRRKERDEVEDFLAAHAHRHTALLTVGLEDVSPRELRRDVI
jgi:hypothetical protein